MVWALRNPRAGVVDAEDLDHASCLAIQRPYLGDLFGRFTDWTPLTGRDLSGTGTGLSAAAPSSAANSSKPASAPASKPNDSDVGAHVHRSAFPGSQIDASDPWQFRNVLLA
jgi:homospermidine synthase